MFDAVLVTLRNLLLVVTGADDIVEVGARGALEQDRPGHHAPIKVVAVLRVTEISVTLAVKLSVVPSGCCL